MPLAVRACLESSGSKLVFTYGPSALKAGQPYTQGFPGGQRCLAPRASGIVIVPATHASNPSSWTFTPPRRGCSYTSAAFDALGIAAFEACAPGHRGSPANDDLGPASIVQLDMHGKVRPERRRYSDRRAGPRACRSP